MLLYSSSPGVTGFDGLFIERRATQCSPDTTQYYRETKLAKNTLASVKSPYFNVSDFAFAYARASSSVAKFIS